LWLRYMGLLYLFKLIFYNQSRILIDLRNSHFAYIQFSLIQSLHIIWIKFHAIFNWRIGQIKFCFLVLFLLNLVQFIFLILLKQIVIGKLVVLNNWLSNHNILHNRLWYMLKIFFFNILHWLVFSLKYL
jgi:hypothetical protein